MPRPASIEQGNRGAEHIDPEDTFDAVWFAKIGAALWSVTIAYLSNGDRRDDRDDAKLDTALRRAYARSRASAAL